MSNDLHVSIATPPEFLLTLPFLGRVHLLSGVDTCAVAQNTLKITEHTQTRAMCMVLCVLLCIVSVVVYCVCCVLSVVVYCVCCCVLCLLCVVCGCVVLCCVVFVVKHPKKGQQWII